MCGSYNGVTFFEMKKAVEFNNIKLKIGNALILDDISFDIDEGDIYGLIGHNGAGKTSLIRILLGLISNYSGSLKIYSDDKPTRQRTLIGSVIDSLEADGRATVKNYIHRICCMTGCGSTDFENRIIRLVGLTDEVKKPISNLSLGMKRRLLIACAMANQPKLLVLDEPFNGIDPEGMADFRLLFQQLSSEGITILITSHNIPELLKLSNKFGIMYKGHFVGEIMDYELSKIQKTKTVFSTAEPQHLVDELKKMFPQQECYADSPGEISLFDEIDSARQEELRKLSTGIRIATMSEEEILLWKMNGHKDV